MTVTSRSKLTAIPDAWLKAATLFVDLRDELPLEDDEWNLIVRWLRETTFDARSCLAGEVAAGLIRDHAPMRVKDEILCEDPTDEWQRRFQRAIVSRSRPFDDTGTRTGESLLPRAGDRTLTVVADIQPSDDIAISDKGGSVNRGWIATARNRWFPIVKSQQSRVLTETTADEVIRSHFDERICELLTEWGFSRIRVYIPGLTESSQMHRLGKNYVVRSESEWYAYSTQLSRTIDLTDLNIQRLLIPAPLALVAESSNPEERELMEAIHEINKQIETLERKRAEQITQLIRLQSKR